MYLYSRENGLINLDYIKTVSVMSIPGIPGGRSDEYHVVIEREDDTKCYTFAHFEDREKALAMVEDIAKAMSNGVKIYSVKE